MLWVTAFDSIASGFYCKIKAVMVLVKFYILTSVTLCLKWTCCWVYCSHQTFPTQKPGYFTFLFWGLVKHTVHSACIYTVYTVVVVWQPAIWSYTWCKRSEVRYIAYAALLLLLKCTVARRRTPLWANTKPALYSSYTSLIVWSLLQLFQTLTTFLLFSWLSFPPLVWLYMWLLGFFIPVWFIVSVTPTVAAVVLLFGKKKKNTIKTFGLSACCSDC